MQTLRLHQLFLMGQEEKHLNSWYVTSDYGTRVDLHNYRYQTFGSTPCTIKSEQILIWLPCQITIFWNYILANLTQRNAMVYAKWNIIFLPESSTIQTSRDWSTACPPVRPALRISRVETKTCSPKKTGLLDPWRCDR